MDPLVFMDFADDMNLSVMMVGAVLVFLPFSLNAPMLSDLVGVQVSLLTTVLFMAFGISTIVGGFLQGEAEYLEYFVDISAALGLLLFIVGPVMNFAVKKGLWTKFSIFALLFISIPSTAMVWYTRESVYEDEKY
ncbi:MAG: hypothetical protein ABEK04_00625 [Candidatus Nanohalobium sp.]